MYRSISVCRTGVLKQPLRRVSTLSPLGIAFNSRPQRKLNILQENSVIWLYIKFYCISILLALDYIIAKFLTQETTCLYMIIWFICLLQGLFEIPQIQDYTGFYLLQQQAEHATENLVAEVTSPNRKRKLVQVFDEISDTLCRVADMVRNICNKIPIYKSKCC